MTREEAYEFIKLYKKFTTTGMKIVDHDADNVEIEYRHPEKGTFKVWRDDWYGAKLIEANS